VPVESGFMHGRDDARRDSLDGAEEWYTVNRRLEFRENQTGTGFC